MEKQWPNTSGGFEYFSGGTSQTAKETSRVMQCAEEECPPDIAAALVSEEFYYTPPDG